MRKTEKSTISFDTLDEMMPHFPHLFSGGPVPNPGEGWSRRHRSRRRRFHRVPLLRDLLLRRFRLQEV